MARAKNSGVDRRRPWFVSLGKLSIRLKPLLRAGAKGEKYEIIWIIRRQISHSLLRGVRLCIVLVFMISEKLAINFSVRFVALVRCNGVILPNTQSSSPQEQMLCLLFKQ